MTATFIRTADDTVAWVSDRDSAKFQQAMKHTCGVCDAKPGRPCWNTIDDAAPLPGRLIHHARAYPKSKSTDEDGDD